MCIWGVPDANLGQDTNCPQVFVVGPNQYPQGNFGSCPLPCRLSNFFSILTSVDAMYSNLLIIPLTNNRCASIHSHRLHTRTYLMAQGFHELSIDATADLVGRKHSGYRR
jgi:hypothetical protein